jgi:hypothetical protein
MKTSTIAVEAELSLLTVGDHGERRLLWPGCACDMEMPLRLLNRLTFKGISVSPSPASEGNALSS